MSWLKNLMGGANKHEVTFSRKLFGKETACDSNGVIILEPPPDHTCEFKDAFERGVRAQVERWRSAQAESEPANYYGYTDSSGVIHLGPRSDGKT
jgi:hypothetical protein